MNCFSIVVNLLCICAAIFGLTPEEVRQIVDLYNNNDRQILMRQYENYNLNNDKYANGQADIMVPEIGHLEQIQIRPQLVKINIILDLGIMDIITIPAFFKYSVFRNDETHAFDFYMIIKSNPEDIIVQMQRVVPTSAGERSFILQTVADARTLKVNYTRFEDLWRKNFRSLSRQKSDLQEACDLLKSISNPKPYWVKDVAIEDKEAVLRLDERIEVVIPGVLKCRRGSIDDEPETNSQILPSDYYYHYVLSMQGWIKVECSSNSSMETNDEKLYALEEYLLNI